MRKNESITLDATQHPHKVGSYAPGNYLNQCNSCGLQFGGDKRALNCSNCAINNDLINNLGPKTISIPVTIRWHKKRDRYDCYASVGNYSTYIGCVEADYVSNSFISITGPSADTKVVHNNLADAVAAVRNTIVIDTDILLAFGVGTTKYLGGDRVNAQAMCKALDEERIAKAYEAYTNAIEKEKNHA